ncbi:MAG TPA: VTT domain-containing protein [Solirubrobacteraceae bacterium]|nr:VTT domain-containing protein [Solirubrobacteraceae bacterium]
MSAPTTDPAGPTTPRARTDLAAGIATAAAVVALILAVPELRHAVGLVLHGHFGALRIYVRSLGAGGLALLLGLMVAHAVVFYPSEIVTATAGFIYGFGPGLGLVIGGWLLTALLSYALGRSIGGPLLRALLGSRFSRLERGVADGGIALLLAGRLIPVVPFAFLGYAAGATHVNLWRFAWTTVLGYLPLTALVAYLGSDARTLSLGNPLIWVAVAVAALMLGAHWAVRRRQRAR